MVQVIKPKDDAEWLKIKEGTIGGSELAIICQLNPWVSPYQFWLTKTKRQPPQEATLVMKRGSYLENGLAEMWAAEEGHRLIKSSAANILYIDEEYPFLSVTPDRRFFHKDGGKRTLEVKTTFGRYDEPLDSWLIQLQWELLFTEHKYGEILYEFPDPRICYKCHEVEANKELQRQLKDIAIEWWKEHIINDKEPPLERSSDIELKFKEETIGKSKYATEDILSLYSEVTSLQSQVNPLLDRIEKIKEEVKMVMMDAESINYLGETLFSWKLDVRDRRIFRVIHNK